MEISSCTRIPPFMPTSVHSSSASCGDYGWIFPDKLRVSSFPQLVPTLYLDSSIVRPLRLRWVKSQHTKWTPKKKILPQLLPCFELATFRSRVRRSYQQAIPAPNISQINHRRRVSVIFRVQLSSIEHDKILRLNNTGGKNHKIIVISLTRASWRRSTKLRTLLGQSRVKMETRLYLCLLYFAAWIYIPYALVSFYIYIYTNTGCQLSLW